MTSSADLADSIPRAVRSNYGPRPHLFAPGVSITSARRSDDTGRVTFSGTSTAASQAAGTAAVFLSGHPKASPAPAAKALAGGVASGRVSGGAPGSPNKILRLPRR
ncbi:S8 family serine peptidase [Streptomyces sp. NPDC005017]|uniref:S8 family serine peptidase n=1 Tax=Streptomyces sp. NPDC005017 TaxID=3364706 RepID=UPI0036AC45D9